MSEQTKTICPYCGVGCGIAVTEDMRFAPWGDAPVNEGRICIKGVRRWRWWNTRTD